ncbi:GDP-mannose 4,6-dehydratase [Taibaiella koreensis]|uniref:GDP-mannose 4,6-dehydratase n=1 Tax=Taibaiella koreensis TaxID=1268548 RepID=UPI000E59DA1B|nr:GDP-mannose 4,6-dehydratase [Taibaiella koreensis]
MNNLEDAPILITGGCGMVGSHLADYYAGRGQRAVATYYTHPTIRLEEVLDKANYIPCDIRDSKKVAEIIAQYKPRIIYHLAAQSYPTVSWEKPAETMDINANGTINVFEAVKTLRKEDPGYDPVVLIACSSAEYGASLKPGNVPVTEDTALLPLHPYGVSKVTQDLLGFQYFANNNIRSIRVRIFNTTGPRKTNDVASDFTKRAVLFEKGEIDVLTTGTLTTERAITDVRDLVEALVLLSEKGRAGEVYNVCGNKSYRISELLSMVETIIGRSLPHREDPSLVRSSDEPVIYGSSHRLIQATGWQQRIPLEQTLSDMIAYWRGIL